MGNMKKKITKILAIVFVELFVLSQDGFSLIFSFLQQPSVMPLSSGTTSPPEQPTPGFETAGDEDLNSLIAESDKFVFFQYLGQILPIQLNSISNNADSAIVTIPVPDQENGEMEEWRELTLDISNIQRENDLLNSCNIEIKDDAGNSVATINITDMINDENGNRVINNGTITIGNESFEIRDRELHNAELERDISEYGSYEGYLQHQAKILLGEEKPGELPDFSEGDLQYKVIAEDGNELSQEDSYYIPPSLLLADRVHFRDGLTDADCVKLTLTPVIGDREQKGVLFDVMIPKRVLDAYKFQEQTRSAESEIVSIQTEDRTYSLPLYSLNCSLEEVEGGDNLYWLSFSNLIIPELIDSFVQGESAYESGYILDNLKILVKKENNTYIIPEDEEIPYPNKALIQYTLLRENEDLVEGSLSGDDARVKIDEIMGNLVDFFKPDRNDPVPILNLNTLQTTIEKFKDIVTSDETTSWIGGLDTTLDNLNNLLEDAKSHAENVLSNPLQPPEEELDLAIKEFQLTATEFHSLVSLVTNYALLRNFINRVGNDEELNDIKNALYYQLKNAIKIFNIRANRSYANSSDLESSTLADIFPNAWGIFTQQYEETTGQTFYQDPETGLWPYVMGRMETIEHNVFVKTFIEESAKMAIMSLAMGAVGGAIGMGLRAIGIGAKLAEFANDGRIWAKALLGFGKVMKSIVKAGTIFDDLGEAGITAPTRFMDLILAGTGNPGALAADSLTRGLTSLLLRIGVNASAQGWASAELAINPNNKFAQFVANPIGFILPQTNVLGNLGDIMEFIDIAIRAAKGKYTTHAAFINNTDTQIAVSTISSTLQEVWNTYRKADVLGIVSQNPGFLVTQTGAEVVDGTQTQESGTSTVSETETPESGDGSPEQSSDTPTDFESTLLNEGVKPEVVGQIKNGLNPAELDVLADIYNDGAIPKDGLVEYLNNTELLGAKVAVEVYQSSPDQGRHGGIVEQNPEEDNCFDKAIYSKSERVNLLFDIVNNPNIDWQSIFNQYIDNFDQAKNVSLIFDENNIKGKNISRTPIADGGLNLLVEKTRDAFQEMNNRVLEVLATGDIDEQTALKGFEELKTLEELIDITQYNYSDISKMILVKADGEVNVIIIKLNNGVEITINRGRGRNGGDPRIKFSIPSPIEEKGELRFSIAVEQIYEDGDKSKPVIWEGTMIDIASEDGDSTLEEILEAGDYKFQGSQTTLLGYHFPISYDPNNPNDPRRYLYEHLLELDPNNNNFSFAFAIFGFDTYLNRGTIKVEIENSWQ
jgi:hypothetical protein